MEIKDKELHRIAITGIVYNKERKYLITKRAPDKKRFPGRWTVPGGGLSTDDYINTPMTGANQWYHSTINALRREVKEETGVEIKTPEYLTDLTFIREDGIPVLVISYFAEYLSGDVVLDSDSTEYAWISVDQAADYDLIEGINQEIEQVNEILKKRKTG